jgi:hypothetical protein
MQTTLPDRLDRLEPAPPLPHDAAVTAAAEPLEAWPQYAIDACAPEGASTLEVGTLEPRR